MNGLKTGFQLIRILFILPGIDWKDKKTAADLLRWKTICNISDSDIKALARLLWEKREFRNLFIYRNRHRVFFRYWVSLWYKPMDTLYIETPEIGGGLFIQHGFATMISAKSIGENCWINQQVTIGYNSKGCPVIGDNVMITCGAKVLGDIKVGDNSVIGANAVVVKDVENDSVMVGIPAYNLKKREDLCIKQVL